MGKKSRKKGAAKGARRDQHPSKRSQQSAAPPAPRIRQQRDDFDSDFDYSDAFSNPNDEREYFVGDRIWFIESVFYDPCNPNTYRGMVRGILPDGQLRIISLQAIMDGDEDATFTIARDKVYPDFQDIMLRFNVGDAVLYNCDDCWSTGKVQFQWPIREICPSNGDVLPFDATCDYSFPHYKCRVDWQDPGALYPFISAPGDDDSLIRLRPTKFRFKVGDAVDINPKKAETTNGRSAAKLAQCTTLVRGKIIAVDVSKPQMNYAVYECSFGKALTCRIFEDTDEYISRADADPRERLFDAIEQNCGRKHLDFLCNQFNIDVLTFKDLVVAKAIESASLEALSWLQLSCEIDVQSMKDECGNNFLHQIAKSSHAARFIRKAGRGRYGDDAYPMVDFIGGEGSLHYQLNNDGELWIQILIKRKNVKALDAALSPHYGFAWGLVLMCPELIQSLQKSIRESELPMMQFIFDSFLSLSELCRQYSCLRHDEKTENELLSDEHLVAFREGDASQSAKVLVRYCRDWCHHRSRYVVNGNQWLAVEFVQSGYFQLFQSFYEADEADIRYRSYYVKSKEDKGEYIQHELYEQDDDEQRGDLEVDIFSACIIGCVTFQSRRNEWSKSTKNMYMHQIRQYAMKIDPRGYPSLHDHLQLLYGGTGGKGKDLFSMHLERLKLLEDDDNVEGRQKILEYLLQKDPSFKLDALLPIKHRQCWALRFMISKRMLQMDSLAIRSHRLIKAAQGLLFLQDGRLEKTTLKLCLCFVAVQYDDLQSLEFLCESYGTPVEMIGGWNLLHFSAYMGRVEIIAWLSSQPVWESLSTQVCVRKEFEGALAVHISARRGHLVACELMIDLNVPLEDSKGCVPEDYAKTSSHQYVLDWVKSRETPKILKTDVNKLFKLASTSDVNKTKDFIKSSSCLDICTWQQCGCFSFGDVGPTGHSFGDVLHELCGAVNIEVAVWICKRLYFWDGYDSEHERFWKSSEQKQRDSHSEYHAVLDKALEEEKISIEDYNELTKGLLPVQEQEHQVKEMLNQQDLVEFLNNQGHDDLSGLLKNKRFKNVSCKEPLTSEILSSALDEGERRDIVRAAILLYHIQLEINNVVSMDIYPVLAKGGGVDEVEELISTKSTVMNALIREGHDMSTSISTPSYYDSAYFSPIDMNLRLHKYNEDHPLRKQLLFLHSSDLVVPHLSIVIATEGYVELMDFCLSNLSGWEKTMELDAARISSYFGHSEITEMFLDDSSKPFVSSVGERQDKIILGTGEALRFRELESLVDKFGAPADPISDFDMNEVVTEFDEYSKRLSISLIACVMNGYLRETSNDGCDNKTTLKTLSLLVYRLGYSHDEILIALILITNVLHRIEEMDRLFDIVWNVINIIGLQPIQHHLRMRQLCEAVTNQVYMFSVFFQRKEENIDTSLITKRFSEMADFGIDVQKLLEGCKFGKKGFGALAMRMVDKPFISELRDLEEKQQRKWSNFAAIKNGASLQKIQYVIDRGELRMDTRDQGGLLLTHLSAAYDRVDVLEWLVATKGMQLTSTDFKGRTVLDVAEASKASKAMRWIAEWNARNRIASFLRRNYFRAMQTRRLEKSKNAATLIQRRVRGYFMRNLYSGALSHRLEESKRFYDIWGDLLRSMPRFSPMSWSATREKYLDIQLGIDDELIDETDRRLREAVDVAVDQDVEEDADGVTDEANANVEVLSTNHDYSSAAVNCTSSNEWLSFQMTSHVVKFLQQGDKKYRSFFVRRMQQLARGERSRILKKPLKGSQSHIFETYLEQKSGHRILWTEEGGNIVVWYVARHKQVSRLMQLIDDSKSRSARQQMPQTLSDELRNDGFVSSTEPKRGVLLDIIGNVPLKVYDISFNSLNEIAKDSWTPRLHLTEEERDIVEADGTVLVLGRSGTGKTVCICNRIECDRQTRAGCDPSFTQLFVARSMRLCKYVEGAVGEDHRTFFCTYLELLGDIETTLPDQQDRRNFNPSNKMDFQRFKREIYNNSASNARVSALILWTVIRTFLKGSIEAFQSPSGILPKEDFLEVERLGKNRCRIPEELRGYIYDEFLRYESYLKERELWDDCDRVHHLMIRIKESKEVDPDAFGQVKKSRVYVDEVQDYTQLEILLFFYLCGPNGLFLAGDPAQSVVEGTEFRFEEVRSVGHFVGSLIQKPKTVNVNFRSHSGILNCAGCVLDLMFAHFPSSAKQLKKDEGLFQGSRPGILSGASIDQLNVLLSDKLKGAVVLTHDESASHWRRRLNDYKRVYGIREAKGLEFKTVIILDFFNELPLSLQKPWRELVLDRVEQDFEYKHPLVGNMLKLLYTGVTRCIEKLFFVETSLSTAGKASIRWLTKKVPKAMEALQQ